MNDDNLLNRGLPKWPQEKAVEVDVEISSQAVEGDVQPVGCPRCGRFVQRTVAGVGIDGPVREICPKCGPIDDLKDPKDPEDEP